jgi:outer membrane protein OmpA-like peptidoglycan-associated protein
MLFFVVIALSVDAAAQIKVDSILAQRVNLGTAINSPAVEIMPVISPDGKTLYFDRKYHPENVGGEDDDDDIYYSTLQPDGTWSPAKNIGPPLNTKGSDVLFWISADGEQALVHHGGKEAGLGITTKKNGKWGKPKAITIEGLNDIHELGDGYSAFISPDHGRLILALSRDKEYPENLDLFSCAALGPDLLRWGPLVSLGDNINTVRAELSPYMAADNRTLYFSTGGHMGYGASDIFVVRRLDDTWESWSDPMNLGYVCNSPSYDIALSISADGGLAYLSAVPLQGEPGYGKSDIYSVKLDDSVSPARIILVKGMLQAGGRGLQGLIRAEGKGEEVGSAASSEDGKFELRLVEGEEYRLTGWSVGYHETAIQVDLRKDVDVINDLVIALKPEGEPKGGSVEKESPKSSAGVLDVTGFTVGSPLLPESAIPELRKFLADFGTNYAGQAVVIELSGHTDNIGTERDNHGLSLERAEEVKHWLVENGVNATMIVVAGRGENSPAAANASDGGRSRNRRVEVRVKKR